MQPRIFVIGFNRCGTTSLHRFFVANNLRSIHWQGGELAQALEERLQGEGPLLGDRYDGIVAFSDMIYLDYKSVLEPYKKFEELDRRIPGSLFILNTRDCERWIASRLKHPNTLERFQSVYDLQDPTSVLHHWRKDFYEHHYRVLDYFGERDDFLHFNIEQDSPKKIAEFLAPHFGPLDIEKFGKHNASAKRSRRPKEQQDD